MGTLSRKHRFHGFRTRCLLPSPAEKECLVIFHVSPFQHHCTISPTYSLISSIKLDCARPTGPWKLQSFKEFVQARSSSSKVGANPQGIAEPTFYMHSIFHQLPYACLATCRPTARGKHTFRGETFKFCHLIHPLSSPAKQASTHLITPLNFFSALLFILRTCAPSSNL